MDQRRSQRGLKSSETGRVLMQNGTLVLPIADTVALLPTGAIDGQLSLVRADDGLYYYDAPDDAWRKV